MAVETSLFINLKGTYENEDVVRALAGILDVASWKVSVDTIFGHFTVIGTELPLDLDLEVLARTIRDLVEGHYSVHIDRVRADSYGLGTKQ